MGNDAAAILGLPLSLCCSLWARRLFFLEIIFYSKGEMGILWRDTNTENLNKKLLRQLQTTFYA